MRRRIAVMALFSRFGGFSAIGVANTLLSLALIWVLNEVLSINYMVSYIASYVMTVILAYVANARLVYRRRLSATDGVKFFLSYLSGMAVGVVLLYVVKLLWPEGRASLISCGVVFVTLIWNFSFVNMVLSKKE